MNEDLEELDDPLLSVLVTESDGECAAAPQSTPDEYESSLAPETNLSLFVNIKVI